MVSLKYFQRYYQFCDLSSYLNHWWHHQFLSKALNISGIKENLLKKKVPFSYSLWKAFQISKYNFLLHRHFKPDLISLSIITHKLWVLSILTTWSRHKGNDSSCLSGTTRTSHKRRLTIYWYDWFKWWMWYFSGRKNKVLLQTLHGIIDT